MILLEPVTFFMRKRNMEGKREISEKKDDLGWGRGKDLVDLEISSVLPLRSP